MIRALFSTVALAVAVLPAGLDAGLFRAAAGRVAVTPPRDLSLWGYSSRATEATGVLDPLYARVLVLDDGTTRLALCTLDLVRTFGPEWMGDGKEESPEHGRRGTGLLLCLPHAFRAGD